MENQSNDMGNQAKEKMAALEGWLAPLFAKFPHLPQSGRDVIVKIAPWLALIFGILGLFGILSLFGLMQTAAFVSMMPNVHVGWYPAAMITLALGAASAVLELMAFKPLGARKKKGWNLLFYATVISIISSVVGVLFGDSGVFGAILGAIIGLWLLFEIRGAYKA